MADISVKFTDEVHELTATIVAVMGSLGIHAMRKPADNTKNNISEELRCYIPSGRGRSVSTPLIATGVLFNVYPYGQRNTMGRGREDLWDKACAELEKAGYVLEDRKVPGLWESFKVIRPRAWQTRLGELSAIEERYARRGQIEQGLDEALLAIAQAKDDEVGELAPAFMERHHITQALTAQLLARGGRERRQLVVQALSRLRPYLEETREAGWRETVKAEEEKLSPRMATEVAPLLERLHPDEYQAMSRLAAAGKRGRRVVGDVLGLLAKSKAEGLEDAIVEVVEIIRLLEPVELKVNGTAGDDLRGMLLASSSTTEAVRYFDRALKGGAKSMEEVVTQVLYGGYRAVLVRGLVLVAYHALGWGKELAETRVEMDGLEKLAQLMEQKRSVGRGTSQK